MASQTQWPLVREARQGDLPRLLELLFQLAQNGQQPDLDVQAPTAQHTATLAEMQRDPRFTLLAIEDEDGVQGTLILYVLPNLSHGAAPFGLVENVVVDAARRGRGYGELLMAEAVRRARAAGCYKVPLLSNVRRPEAHRFYERIGFHNTHKGFTRYLDGA